MQADTRAETTAEAMLEAAGYRIEGPGRAADGALRGCYWWTLMRDGWSGVECGPEFATEREATQDAIAALLADEDLDWSTGTVLEHAIDQFPSDFPAAMRAWRKLPGRRRRRS